MAQRRPPRAPFVVTIALAAAAGSCGGSTTGDGTGASGGIGGVGAEGGASGTYAGGVGGVGGGVGGVGGVGAGGVGGVSYGGAGANPPAIPCPESLPADGDPCPQGSYWGNSCWFPDPCGDPAGVNISCIGPSWSVPAGTGQCDPCPPMEPIEGDACNTIPSEQCSYTGCCPVWFTCTNGVWAKASISCNPPFPQCPSEPPQPGSGCSPCGDCSWNTCGDGGAITTAHCGTSGWEIAVAPCADGGA